MQDATHFRVGGIDDERGAEWILHRLGVWTAGRSLDEALRATLAPAEFAVEVHGDHGRWVVKCPDCNGAQLAAPNDHRYMCNECANIAIGGHWRPVVWPRDHVKLGAILDQREDPARRNYSPGETAALLKVENEHLKAVAAGKDHPGGLGVHAHHPGKASLHEGHTHTWPKRLRFDEAYECPGCEQTFWGSSLVDDPNLHTHDWPARVEPGVEYPCRSCGLGRLGKHITGGRG